MFINTFFCGVILFISLSAAIIFSAAAIIDIRKMIIPDKLIIVLFLLGFSAALLSFAFPQISEKPSDNPQLLFFHLSNCFLHPSLKSRFFGAIIIPLLFCLFNIARHDSVGGGDIKLISSGGFLTGFSGICFTVITATLLAGLFAAVSLLTKTKERNDSFPFAPFIAFGFIVFQFSVLL